MKSRQVDVLIIEDNSFDAELICRALYVQASHLTTAVVATGAAAIEYLQTHSSKAITAQFLFLLLPALMLIGSALKRIALGLADISKKRRTWGSWPIT